MLCRPSLYWRVYREPGHVHPRFHGSVCSLTQPGLGSDFWGLNPSLTSSPEGSGLSGFGDIGQRTCPGPGP